MSKNSSISIMSRAGRGQTMTEYALILATIAAVLVSLYTSAGTIRDDASQQGGSSPLVSDNSSRQFLFDRGHDA